MTIVGPHSALVDHLVGLSSRIEEAGRRSPMNYGRIAELGRRVDQLQILEATDRLTGQQAEGLLKRAGELSASLVRALRLPESLLEPLRANKLVAVGYAEVGKPTTTHTPLPAMNPMTVQFGLPSASNRRARELPYSYTAQHKELLPTPTEPLPSMWETETPDFPGREGPGRFFADVDLQALPTLPVEECLHRLLFSRSPGPDQTNWAGGKLFDPHRMKWPAEDADPLVLSLRDHEANLPEVFGREALGRGLWQYVDSARGLFPVVEELLDAADEHGNVDLARLFCHYHRDPLPPRHQMTEALARALMSPVEDPEQPIAASLKQSVNTKMAFKTALPLCESYEELSTVLTAFEKRFPKLTTSYLEKSFGWPPTLPALDVATRDVPADQFEDCVLLCAQHLIPSQLPLFDELISHGAEASDVFVAGVPYSTNPLVAGMLRGRGMTVVESEGNATSILGNYEDARIDELRPVIDIAVQRARESGKKLVVLDDGGIVSRLLHDEHPEVLAQTRLVEQTTRGLTENARVELGCPGVGVAKCEAKDEEAPFVAEDMLAELCELLPSQGINSLEGVAITIVGNGPIGGSMAEACRRAKMDVRMVDTDESARADAVDAGIPRDKVFGDIVEAAAGTQIVIGCTGHKSLPREILDQLPDNVIVASGSSAEVEIDTEHLVHNGEHRLREQVQTYWLGNKRIRLANGGRPLNFDNTRDGDPDKVQLTRALMFQAAVQAAAIPDGTEFGFTNLTRKRQAPIVDYMREQVWSRKEPYVPKIVAQQRDETAWAEVEEAFANGRDFGDLLTQHDGDRLFWMGPMLRSAPNALDYGADPGAAPDRRRSSHTVLAAPNGRMYVASNDDPMTPPFFELPFDNQIPVRIEKLNHLHDTTTRHTSEHFLLWLDDEEGKRTTHHVRLDYEPKRDDTYGVWPKHYGKDGEAIPKFKATVVASYPDAALVSEHTGDNGLGGLGRGAVLASNSQRVRIDPSGQAHVLDDNERWFGPVRITGRRVSLAHSTKTQTKERKRTLGPEGLRSIDLPESIASVEDVYTAVSNYRKHDDWPHLSPDKAFRSSSLLVCRDQAGGRVAINVNWSWSGKQPTITATTPLPADSRVRHAEPFGTGDKRSPGVLWKVFTFVPEQLDERSEWPVTEV